MQAGRLIAITPGEPAGIGPDITLMLAQRTLTAIPIAIADPDLLQSRAETLKLDISIQTFDPATPPLRPQKNLLYVWPVPLREASVCGQLNPANAAYVLQCLEQAVSMCSNNSIHAMVTGPIHKGCIIESGRAFSGHTEFLGELTGSQPVMMLVADRLRVALLTTHIPLASVVAAINQTHLQTVLQILHHDLRYLFTIDAPRIAVTGLNPHAGEQGHMGREEIDVIIPVLERLRAQGMRLIGPLPADTAFTPAQLQQCDAILTMYHDQGLPVLKHAGFGNAVNITLGLPIIRTSVDHGTALDLAGSGKADAGSLLTAFKLAAALKK